MNQFNKYVGQIFTPYWVAKFMIKYIDERDFLSLKFLEPAAGVGNIVLELYKKVIKKARQDNLSPNQIKDILIKNIYAFEIDEDNYLNLVNNLVYFFKEELNIDVRREDLINIKNVDTLRWEFNEEFDIVLANPPFTPVKFLPKKTKEYIIDNFKYKEDICQTFVEKSFSLLKKKGKMLFLLPSNIKKEKWVNDFPLEKTIDFDRKIFTANIDASLFVFRR